MTVAIFTDFEINVVNLFKMKLSKNASKHKIVHVIDFRTVFFQLSSVKLFNHPIGPGLQLDKSRID